MSLPTIELINKVWYYTNVVKVRHFEWIANNAGTVTEKSYQASYL